MIKTVTPVSRRRPFFGQPPTTGVPRRVFGGLKVSSRTTRAFIAGAVVSLGIVPEATSRDAIVTNKFNVSQVRNDRRDGRVIRTAPATNLRTQFVPKPTKVVNVKNYERKGIVVRWEPEFVPRTVESFIIHRQESTVVRRFRPRFGELPPISTTFVTWKVTTFNIFRRPNGQELQLRNGRVCRTGPKRPGAAVISGPGLSRGISVSFKREVRSEGRVFKTSAPRSTFFINVPRVPRFSVYRDYSRDIIRRTKAQVNRTIPRNNTSFSFRYLNIYRGTEVVVYGQEYKWGPRRVDFIPSIEQFAPKPIKIFKRQVLPIHGQIIRFGPRRETPSIVTAGLIKPFKIAKVYNAPFGSYVGKVIVITPFKRNPPPSGSLNHGLVRLSEFKILLSVKRENDGGKADVFAADANGTVVTFNKAFRIVESITVTSLNTALQTPVYIFTHTTQNPTTFLVKLFDSAGARVDGTVSWKARGIL